MGGIYNNFDTNNGFINSNVYNQRAILDLTFGKRFSDDDFNLLGTRQASNIVLHEKGNAIASHLVLLWMHVHVYIVPNTGE